MSLKIVRMFLKNGIDSTVREAKNGNTALHLALSNNVDPELLKVKC